MEISLNKSGYNSLFAFLSQGLKGHAGAAVVAGKIIEQIRAGADEGKAEEVKISVEVHELEAMLKGIVATLSAVDDVTVAHVAELTYVAELLKIKKAFAAELEKLVPADAKVEIDSEIVLDD